jgi:hypothetical protein
MCLMAKAGTWVKLVENNQVPRVTKLFESVIEKSLETHPMRHLTQSAVKDRFDKCAEIFEVLRGDLKWSLMKIEAHLPGYFQASMNGEDWKPSTRDSWVRNDQTRLVQDGDAIEGDERAIEGLDEEVASHKRLILPGDPGFSMPN